MNIKTKLYVTENYDKDFIPICESKDTLMHKKSAYVEMCILDLSKV